MRDLLLNRVPKDFDVITTANLQQVIYCCFNFIVYSSCLVNFYDYMGDYVHIFSVLFLISHYR